MLSLMLSIKLCLNLWKDQSKGGRYITPLPEQSRVKLCLLVVSVIRKGCIKNFRPLRHFFLVDLSLMIGCGGVGGVVVCKVIFMSNQTSVEDKLG